MGGEICKHKLIRLSQQLEILRARLEDPLEALLGQDGLSRLGAVMAVDETGVLRGIVTVDAVRRALRGAVTV